MCWIRSTSLTKIKFYVYVFYLFVCRAVINEIKGQCKEKSSDSPPRFTNELLEELCPYLDCAGVGDSYAKIYVTTSNMRFFPLFIFLFTIFQLTKLQWQKNTCMLFIITFNVGKIVYSVIETSFICP